MFNVDESGNVTMHRGDTGAFKVRATRHTGEAWTADDRLLFTIRNAAGDIVIQRIYRLDDDDGLGNGVVEIQFHNSDTDSLPNGTYQVERRYNVHPYWDGTPPEGMCVDALTADARMIEGDCVRTVFQGNLTISDVYGDI